MEKRNKGGQMGHTKKNFKTILGTYLSFITQASVMKHQKEADCLFDTFPYFFVAGAKNNTDCRF
jgi:hypothetical protein